MVQPAGCLVLQSHAVHAEHAALALVPVKEVVLPLVQLPHGQTRHLGDGLGPKVPRRLHQRLLRQRQGGGKPWRCVRELHDWWRLKGRVIRTEEGDSN
jgi:hypothetical protein